MIVYIVEQLQIFNEEIMEAEDTILSNGYGLFSTVNPLDVSDTAAKEALTRCQINQKISITDDAVNIPEYHCIVTKDEGLYFIEPLAAVRLNGNLLPIGSKTEFKNLDRIEFVS